jgi:general secretion pathway protein A
MYEKFYGFQEKPFSLTPDPKFFYYSKDHIEAIEHLIYGVLEGEGFLMLAGEVGAGKTTISRYLMNKLEYKVVTSLILNPFLDFFSLLQNILRDFGMIPMGEGKEELIDQLKEYLINDIGPRSKTALIIIDEAQNLTEETMEELRVISNIETDKEKLLQILLVGQEELIQKLEQQELRQLNQRISVRYFLNSLKAGEIPEYIQHRLKTGAPDKPIKFTRAAVKKIYKFSAGIPRKVNMLANRALISGFVCESRIINRKMVMRAQASLFGEKYNRIRKKGRQSRFFFRRRRSDEFNL